MILGELCNFAGKPLPHFIKMVLTFTLIHISICFRGGSHCCMYSSSYNLCLSDCMLDPAWSSFGRNLCYFIVNISQRKLDILWMGGVRFVYSESENALIRGLTIDNSAN